MNLISLQPKTPSASSRNLAKIAMLAGMAVLVSACDVKTVRKEEASPPAGVDVAVPNPGFEEGGPGKMPAGYAGSGRVILDNPHSGKQCLQQTYVPGHNWNKIQSPFIPSGENRAYELGVWCRNTVAAGEVALGVRAIQFKDGKPVTVKYNWKPVVNNVNTWQKYTLKFTTPPKNEALSIYLSVSEGVPSGEVFWDDLSLTEVPVKDELLSVKPLRSAVFFKTGEGLVSRVYDPAARKFVEIPAKDAFAEVVDKAKGLALEVGLSEKYNEKNRVYREKAPVGGGRIPLRIEALPAGHYVWSAKLMDGGKIVASQEKEIIINGNRPPVPVLEPVKNVEIDADKNLRVNGKPFLMSFYFHYPLELGALQELRGAFGATTAQVSGGGSIEALCANVETAWQAGIYSWAVLFHPAMYDHQTQKWNDAALLETVNRLKNHPGLIGWDLIDEPDATTKDEAMTAELARVTEIIRKLDPNHPIWVNLCQSGKFHDYARYSDLASYDTYPFPDMSLSVIENNNRKILEAGGNTKPLLSILQAWAQAGNRGPTYAEMRAETYLCVTQGMKAFAFYTWGDPEPQFCLERSPEHQSYVQNLMTEMNVLKDFLSAPTPPQPELKELSGKGIKYLYKPVNGRNTLVVVNTTNAAQSYTLPLPNPAGEKTAEVLFEDGRTIGVKNGVMEDVAAPLEVHVYRY